MPTTTDRIEKLVTLDAPRSRVWQAITDVHQFNEWFGISLTGPFRAGVPVTGRMRSPKYAHIPVTFWIEAVEPEHFFSFRWHPYAIEEGIDYESEPTTLVTFTLEDAGRSTRLAIVESGFDAIPESRRARAFSANSGGWEAQSKNLQKYVAAADAPLYGVAQLVAGMRAVRANTIGIAEDIPESHYGHRATPTTRSIGETLVHIAWLATSDRILHEEARIHTVEGYDFPAHLEKSAIEEKRPRSKAEIIELLRAAGEAQAKWLEQMPPNFFTERVKLPGGASMSRFEMLLATKEHELQHRAQITVLERMIGVAPRFTGLA
jgi:uncharacterized protein YndB with AHSA1/START domain/uncharacterized damage-inducible protein DinB